MNWFLVYALASIFKNFIIQVVYFIGGRSKTIFLYAHKKGRSLKVLSGEDSSSFFRGWGGHFQGCYPKGYKIFGGP